MAASVEGKAKNYCSLLAGQVIHSSYLEIRRRNAWEEWSEKLAADCTRLGEAHCCFTESLYHSAFFSAANAYRKHYTFTHQILPLAEASAGRMIGDVYGILRYCDGLLSDVWRDVDNCLNVLKRENKIRKFADEEAKSILDSVLGRDVPSSDDPAAAEVKTDFDISSSHLVVHPGSHNQNNNCSIEVDRPTVACRLDKIENGEMRGAEDASERFRLFANDVVSDLLAGLRHADMSSVSQKSSSHCGSRESLSSDLMSPRSTADSRGLHQFADKLLYSLSILENGSNDSISEIGVCYDVKERRVPTTEGSRRSSAPELRTMLRRYGLQTVLEETVPIRRSSVHGVRVCGSSSRKVHSSSLESIEDSCLGRLQYSEMLTKDILCSAYIDAL